MAYHDKFLNQQKPGQDDAIEMLPTVGTLRNVDFVQVDGVREFINYADISSARYIPEESRIEITTRNHFITLQGINLAPVYKALRTQQLEKVTCLNRRYAETEENKPAVFEMIITPTNRLS